MEEGCSGANAEEEEEEDVVAATNDSRPALILAVQEGHGAHVVT